MRYLISPKEKNDLSIDLLLISEKLKSEWSKVDIQTIINPNRKYSLQWQIPIENRILEGMVAKDRMSIALEGDIRDCAKFALWLRSQIDPKYQLFFYDQGYSADVELRKETTEEEIVKQFVEF
ncbi:MAG TPA: hypothetical protein DCL61_07860 [Cyanobacteria bacterium UBA12227]|nr:hypothetical protein [Cyanobacteria bacterium UBA12227]HAX90505.1 hypothetical protein [Cyanobacteria bacterium UBA11370]HBY80237.1 hypothetical protein [Cyanobacteria bacterium UBA11148]